MNLYYIPKYYADGWKDQPVLCEVETEEWIASIFLPKGCRPTHVSAYAYAVGLIRELGHTPDYYDLRTLEEFEEAGVDMSFGKEINYKRVEPSKEWLTPYEHFHWEAPPQKIVTITKVVDGRKLSMDFPENGRTREELEAIFDNMMPGLLGGFIEHKKKKLRKE